MKKNIIFSILLLISLSSFAQVSLPRLISDGMVLQRDKKIKIWGWASPGEKIAVSFNKKTYQAVTNSERKWEVVLPAMKASGPFTMEIKGSNQITIKDILIGDVWVCSGQSNMELTMERVKDKYPDVIKNSANTNIRQFLVPDQYDFKKPNHDVSSGSWVSASPATLLSFSAVAYFFAKDIHTKYNVPIGLINSALGGSLAESWMSEDALKEFPELHQELQQFKDDNYIKEIEASDRNRNIAWHKDLNAKDEGLSKWTKIDVEDQSWAEIHVPGYWADGALGNVNGVVWFRKKINVPPSMTGKAGRIWLGRIVDADSVFVNGKFVGTTSYQYPPRKYDFNSDLLREGENTIAVRVINSEGRGGFVLDKPYFITIGTDTIPLRGKWKYKLGTSMPKLEGPTAIRWKPAGLYNKMIAPLISFPIKGVIWYQGEANTWRKVDYAKLFPALIKNWRDKWKQGDFPFLYVQLANFMEVKSEPSESQWAALRYAQFKTLALPNTGMAVAIDVGEWNDIHPLNKEVVGNRLALAAQGIAYQDKKVVYSGPLYQSMKVNGNKIEITFSHVGGGLIAKGSQLKYFAIAGADQKFVWAKAVIQNNKVIVWNDEIKNPVAVRYAWADNPEGANLYNTEGLPASPFTTEK
ncbi:MAG TPA: sialate O-acetylesterase [Cyclobacteriaceae bacterium]